MPKHAENSLRTMQKRTTLIPFIQRIGIFKQSSSSFPPRFSLSSFFSPLNSLPPSSFALFFIISLSQGGLFVLLYYKGEVAEALADVFPDIGLDRTKFSTRRMFFLFLFLF